MGLKEKELSELSQADSHAVKNLCLYNIYAFLNGQLGEENVKYVAGNLSSFRLGWLIHQTST